MNKTIIAFLAGCLVTNITWVSLYVYSNTKTTPNCVAGEKTPAAGCVTVIGNDGKIDVGN